MSTASVPALRLEDVWLSFRGTPVLEAIDLTLAQGEFLGIIGPNGAGKSVLLRLLLGLLEPDQGRVEVLGLPPLLARAQVGYVPQSLHFDRDFPMRVMDVVLMGRLGRDRVFRRYGERDREAARAALERVGVGHLADRQVGRLSGGQLQRVLIARALTVDARLLFLDEPTSSLDTRVGVEFYELIRDIAGDRTVILVSHDLGVMNRYATSVACLNRKLFYHGPKQLTREIIEETYGCPVDVLVHSHSHRVLEEHGRTS
jgi:zinc transport system ATP-binding protein